ncbi:class I SAM-dependent methyltransferase [Melghirimyces algeriensis]|uniref:SAM-dependent methyltransferase, MidA family n=1 Tax=Melghirimyces algeriensis TaxID=910412 RepID=A0A521BMT8_9BACL|nr:SAM-dependent methyltransferase [Melghirimyces algeriensis]SMO48474.1 SAM-dependent methyltransferase, MidA family [Melghirimyces algeriensis]
MDQPLLLHEIVSEIQKTPRKAISFRRYMELALYHPEWGYYHRMKPKIGKEGDFYTSPAVGEAFGWTLAKGISHMVQSFPEGSSWYLIEAGAGDGILATHMIQGLDRLGFRPRRLFIVETSSYYRAVQKQMLVDSPVSVYWVEEIRDLPNDLPCILVSNEFFDAFPVHRVISQENGIKEIFVTWDDQKKELVECLFSPSRTDLSDYFLEMDWNLPVGWSAEVPLDALNWLETLGQWLKNGYVITMDYGGTTEELSVPARKNGTLRCYHKHQLHQDFYSDPGTSDITCHVHFSALMKHGSKVGLNNLLYTTQARFLLRSGIWTLLVNPPPSDPFGQVARRNRAIRHLALEEGMGSAFQVLIQSKGIQHPVAGLMQEDCFGVGKQVSLSKNM